MKSFTRIIVVLLVTVAAAVTATTANAADPGPGYIGVGGVRVIKSNETAKCLDDSVYGLRVFRCNGLVFQKFDVTNNPNGTHYLVNLSTGRCIEDPPSGIIHAANCNGASNQMWYINNWGTGGWGFTNKRTNRCIYNKVAGAQWLIVTVCNWDWRPESFSLLQVRR
ncbi:RICIN domain-containing protein [Nonomuraea angiospora]|uniref:RICIN domain-containing protein n=1 Tax=Nonomuraea angiospora TaxID=46172 RepID=UPI0033D846EF